MKPLPHKLIPLAPNIIVLTRKTTQAYLFIMYLAFSLLQEVFATSHGFYTDGTCRFALDIWQALNTHLLFVETILTVLQQTESKPLRSLQVLKLFNIRVLGIKTLLS